MLEWVSQCECVSVSMSVCVYLVSLIRVLLSLFVLGHAELFQFSLKATLGRHH